MKVITRWSIAIFVISFIILNLITISINSPSDGNDLIGFPFPYYEYLGGKRFPEPESRHLFRSLNLVIDFLVIGIPSLLLGRLISKKTS